MNDGCPTCVALDQWKQAQLAVDRARTDKGRLRAQAKALQVAGAIINQIVIDDPDEHGEEPALGG